MTIYKIITKGIQAEAEAAVVIPHLCRLLKIDAQRAERLLVKKPIVLKRTESVTTAKKYRVALNKAGLICIVKQVMPPNTSNNAPPSPSSQTETSSTPPPVTEVNPHLPVMVCPNCGYSQPKSIDCVQCGIIITRYKKNGDTQSIKKLMTPVEEPAPPPTPKWKVMAAIAGVLLLVGGGLTWLILSTHSAQFTENKTVAPVPTTPTVSNPAPSAEPLVTDEDTKPEPKLELNPPSHLSNTELKAYYQAQLIPIQENMDKLESHLYTYEVIEHIALLEEEKAALAKLRTQIEGGEIDKVVLENQIMALNQHLKMIEIDSGFKLREQQIEEEKIPSPKD